jgi:Alanine-zipper, major outer membrane lipoprotein
VTDAPKLLGTDTLRIAYPKVNMAIDNANAALRNSNDAVATAGQAVKTANQALQNSESTQTQLDNIIIENGQSDAEVVQARTKADGTTFPVLRDRLNAIDSEIRSIEINALYPPAPLQPLDTNATDNMTRLQAIHDYIVNTGMGKIVIPNGLFRMEKGLKWNQRKVDIEGSSRTVFDFTNSMDQYAVEYTSSDTIEQDNTKIFKKIVLIGPPASSGKDCIYTHAIENASGSFVVFKDVAIFGFRYQQVIGDHSPFTTFENCVFRSLGGENYQTETSIFINSSNNSGEQHRYIGCQFGNVKTIIENSVTGFNGGLNFEQCGFDYFKELVKATFPIRITIQNSHIESNTFTSNWINISGNGTSVRINSSEIWLTAQVTNYLFKVVNTTLGGIFLDNVFFTAPHGFSVDYLTDPVSNGTVIFDKTQGFNGQVIPPVGFSANLVPYSTDNSTFGSYFTKLPGDSSTITISSAKTYRSLNTTNIKTNATGNEIKLKFFVPIDNSQKIIKSHIFISSTGFVVSQWRILAGLADENKNTMSTMTIFNNQMNSDFKKFEWYRQARDSKAKYFYIDIYAQPQDASETERNLYLADFVVNLI